MNARLTRTVLKATGGIGQMLYIGHGEQRQPVVQLVKTALDGEHAVIWAEREDLYALLCQECEGAGTGDGPGSACKHCVGSGHHGWLDKFEHNAFLTAWETAVGDLHADASLDRWRERNASHITWARSLPAYGHGALDATRSEKRFHFGRRADALIATVRGGAALTPLENAYLCIVRVRAVLRKPPLAG